MTAERDPKNAADVDDLLLPPSVREQIEQWLASGYSRHHLVISPEGAVLYDSEAVDYDASMRVFHPETTVDNAHMRASGRPEMNE